MKKFSKKTVLTTAVCALIMLGAVITALLFRTRVKSSVTVEAGTEITLDMFYGEKMPKNAALLTDVSLIDTSVPSVHNIKISELGRTVVSKLTVADTVSPTAVVKDSLSAWKGKPLVAVHCFDEITDATATAVEWLTAPKDSEGVQTGSIRITDLGGNYTDYEVTVTVTEDTEAPTLDGIKDITAYLYDSVDLLDGVMVTDDKDTSPTLRVDTEAVDFNAAGSYPVTYTASDGAGNTVSVSCTLRLTPDTEAPTLHCRETYNVPVNCNLDLLTLPMAKDNSASDLKTEITGRVDRQAEGSYPVVYTVSDKTGNSTTAECIINVATDTVPPHIAVKEIRIFLGDSISYKKQITVTDDFVGTPTVKVDSSKVNMNKVGSYVALFTATDISGNSSTAEIPVSITERPSVEEETHKMVDELISEIIAEDMTQLEQLYAIFLWANKNIYYSDTSDKSNYVKAAYDALTTRWGDCYSYYSVCRLLMEHLGFEQTEIRKKHPTSRHWWSLVKYNGEWYHFDSSRFVTGNGLTFMLTDEEAAAWDKKYYSIGHVFDAELYPERAKNSIQHLVDHKNKKIIKQ